ncbi:MAG: hypothetical protein IJ194_03100 [Bacilli bacterium]|nr:hypothetical protein [Bacilli bacterium]
MKQRKYLFFLPALFLFSCTPATSASDTTTPVEETTTQDSKDSKITSDTTSEETTTTTKKSEIEKLFDDLALDNATLYCEDYRDMYYYSHEAMFIDYAEGTDYGLIRNLDQGLFSYDIVDGKLELGTLISTNKDYRPVDYMPSPSRLVSFGVDAWTELGNRQYTTTDWDLQSLLASFAGYTLKKGTVAGRTKKDKVENCILEISDSVTEKVKISASVVPYDTTVDSYSFSFTLGEITATESEEVDAYLENPTILVAPTAFTKEEEKMMTQACGEVLPFFDGFTFAYESGGAFNSKKECTDFQILDYGAGDKSEEYGKLLEENGWIYSEEYSDPTGKEEGYPIFIYEKIKQEATDYSPKMVYQVQVDFWMPAKTSSDYQRLQNGMFQIFAGTFVYPATIYGQSNINLYMNSQFQKEDKTPLFPDFNFDESKIQNMVFVDYTATANHNYGSHVYDAYDRIDASCDSRDTAVAQLSAYGDLLAQEGFTKIDNANYEFDGSYHMIGYSISTETFKNLNVYLELAYENGEFNNGILILIQA